MRPKKKSTKNLVPTPHDRFVRASMNDPRVAKEFFETHLPAHIAKRVDLSTLKMEPGTFLDEELELQVTDVLFSLNFDGKKGYLYTLIEHLRNPDRWMPFRKLKYSVKIMDQVRKKTKKLPIVYVLVVYNGDKKYPYSTDLFDLFGEDKELARSIFFSPLYLIDLTQIGDEELRKKTWLGVFEMALKHVYDEDVVSFIQGVRNLFREIEEKGGVDYVKVVFYYLFAIKKRDNLPEIKRVIHTCLSPQLEEKIMTIAEMWHQEGRQEGRQEVTKELAIQLLKDGTFGEEKIAQLTGLSVAFVHALRIKEPVLE